MLIYVIDERKVLDSDSMQNNRKLTELIELRSNYKIPLLILLTHFDNYCDEVRTGDKQWRKTCKNDMNNNKINLLSYINNLIEDKFKSEYKMKEDDIMHVILVEPGVISDEEVIKKLPKKIRDKYDNGDEEKKSDILETFRSGMDSNNSEVRKFFEEENLGILDQKKLIEKIKEILPSQYHNALVEVNQN